LAVYRREVAKRSAPDSAPADRSPVLRDLYGELSSPHQFTRVAEAMIELDRPADALAWAHRGIADTTGWQVANLYDLAADLLADTGDIEGVVGLRRHHHERMPSSSTYANLQTAARANGTWDVEIAGARAVLAARDTGGLIDALLTDGDTDEAWHAATSGDPQLASSQWERLAKARERAAPHEAMEVYLRLADDALEQADKRAYRVAVRHLKAARRTAAAADRTTAFREHLAGLRERNRRRPTLISMLDKAGLE
jgi:uncharacterized Zn finger protein